LWCERVRAQWRLDTERSAGRSLLLFPCGIHINEGCTGTGAGSAKLPNVLDTGVIGRMIQNGRVVRNELKCTNIKPDKVEQAWEIVEVGLLANRYATLFADSLSMASFYTESMDVDSHDDSKVIDVEALRDQYIEDKTNENIDMATHPLMRRFCNSEYCDANRYVEMAKVAAVSCMHHCIPTRAVN